MAITIDSALTSSPNISDARELLREFRLNLGSLEQEITIRLWRHVGKDGVSFEQSHFAHTPENPAAPYQTNVTWAEDEASATALAVKTLTLYFDMAVRAGRTPADEWLVANPHF